MRKKLLIALAVIVVIFAVFAGVVAMQPSEYRVTRTATMAAPPNAVFAQVNDLHKWEVWSPCAQHDPQARYSYEGPPAGTGAVLTWSGNDKVGEGKMTITESQPNERIRIKLDFISPFEDTCDVTFAFNPEGDKTVVTWTMEGRNDFIGKAFGLFMDMDQMIGSDFEKGLASMKSVVEAKSQP
jgi:uncharacterized protein YndB with AHSA1/START domain